jgi:hypothetical protein
VGEQMLTRVGFGEQAALSTAYPQKKAAADKSSGDKVLASNLSPPCFHGRLEPERA